MRLPTTDLMNAGLLLLALNVYHEARGEPFLAQVDVANVVLNRVESPRYPNTIRGVITQGGERRNRCQFSWYCDGKKDEAREPFAWKVAIRAAAAALNGYDTSGGALHYYNPKKATPYWAVSYAFVKVSGNHIFLE